MPDRGGAGPGKASAQTASKALVKSMALVLKDT